jgi:hypothetical protein
MSQPQSIDELKAVQVEEVFNPLNTGPLYRGARTFNTLCSLTPMMTGLGGTSGHLVPPDRYT